jgi:hypothetical protein
MVDEDAPTPVGEVPSSPQGDKVRRSIFIPQELESSLARLADERGTTTNDLICDILARAVASLEGTSGEQA